jgi:hypothetical protein
MKKFLLPVLSLAFVQVPCVAIDLPDGNAPTDRSSAHPAVPPSDEGIEDDAKRNSEEVADRLLRNIPPSSPNYLVNRNKIINALATVSQYKRQKLEEFLTSKKNFKNGLGISRFPFDRRTFLIEVLVTREESEWKEVTQSHENMLRMEQQGDAPVLGPGPC